MATKAELKSAQNAYDGLMALAREAEVDLRFGEAIRHAMAAWEHVEAMMRYERRFEGAEFSSVPCVDMVLRLAPLIFDQSSLDTLASVLKSRRSIDRNASDDLAARLLEARTRLRTAHQLWSHLELHPGCRQDRLSDELGGDQAEWRELAERWGKMGLVTRQSESTSYRLWITTSLDEMVQAKCAACGTSAAGRKAAFFAQQKCPKCGSVSDFIIQGALMAAGGR